MEFNENVIYEPDCFAIRRMPAHSDHGYYATGKEADGVESSFHQPQWQMEICICQ